MFTLADVLQIREKKDPGFHDFVPDSPQLTTRPTFFPALNPSPISNDIAEELMKYQSDTRLSLRPDTPDLHEISQVHLLSEEEAKEKLKDYVYLLSEKQRDLTIAAEIGQHLLKANSVLKTAYEDLLEFAKSKVNITDACPTADEILREALIHVNPFDSGPVTGLESDLSEDGSLDGRQGISSPSSDPTDMQSPRTAHDDNEETIYYEGMGDLASPLSVPKLPISVDWTDIQEALSPKIGVKRNRPQIQQSAPVMRQEPVEMNDEYILSLEYSVADLTSQVQKRQETEMANLKLIKKLQDDLDNIRGQLSATMKEVEQLELEKRKLVRERVQTSREQLMLEQNDRAIIDELLERAQVAEDKYQALLNVKYELEAKVDILMEDFLNLKEKCEELEERVSDTEYLRYYNARQARYIVELRDHLEDERQLTTQLMMERAAVFGGDGGFHDIVSGSHPPSPAPESKPEKPYFFRADEALQDGKSDPQRLQRQLSMLSINSSYFAHKRRDSNNFASISRAMSPSGDDEWLQSPDTLVDQSHFWAGPNINRMSGMGLRGSTHLGIGKVGPLTRPLLPSPLNNSIGLEASTEDDDVKSVDESIRNPFFLRSPDIHATKSEVAESGSETPKRFIRSKLSVKGQSSMASTSFQPGSPSGSVEEVVSSDGVPAVAVRSEGVLFDKWNTFLWKLVGDKSANQKS
ncbi:hypothetical protein HK098_001267 [Nowakowskiella sp. JEL0407]|nr:hypothetical protein HK098_001267 [Nowakowskiella sp. JEL0407]